MIALYCIDHVLDDRRKFRSQTSDNMERWKSRGGNSQRRESVRGKKMQVREKVKKVAKHCFSNNFVAPEGRCGFVWQAQGILHLAKIE